MIPLLAAAVVAYLYMKGISHFFRVMSAMFYGMGNSYLEAKRSYFESYRAAMGEFQEVDLRLQIVAVEEC